MPAGRIAKSVAKRNPAGDLSRDGACDTLDAMWASRVVAAVAALALASGCFGYNRSAKRWAYAGNVVLMLGGGAAIGGSVMTEDEACTGNGCPRYETPIERAAR